MSTTFFAYLEAYNPEPPTNWTCITHHDSYDGYSFKNKELLPDITYPLPKSDLQYMIRHYMNGVKSLKSNELSKTLHIEYQNLSKDVTGKPNSLHIYSVSLDNLVDNYNQLVNKKHITPLDSTEEQLLNWLTDIIRKLTNSYYYQLNIAGDPLLLNPDQEHELELNDNTAENIRLTGWMDA